MTFNTKKMKLLVTGASGFIGHEVSRQLSLGGYRPRLMIRQAGDDCDICHFDADFVIADLRKPSSLKQAVKGVDGIVHLGARATFESYAILKPSILEGSLALMQAGIEMDLLFRTDEYALADTTGDRLAALARDVAQMRDIRVQLDGFADERGRKRGAAGTGRDRGTDLDDGAFSSHRAAGSDGDGVGGAQIEGGGQPGQQDQPAMPPQDVGPKGQLQHQSRQRPSQFEAQIARALWPGEKQQD